MLFLILVAVAPGVAGAVVGIPFLILFGGIFLAVNLLLYPFGMGYFVPPVPTPATKMSTVPSVSAQISGPVVALWTAGFAGLTNWPAKKLFGIWSASSCAFAMAPFMPFEPSVRTSCAP